MIEYAENKAIVGRAAIQTFMKRTTIRIDANVKMKTPDANKAELSANRTKDKMTKTEQPRKSKTGKVLSRAKNRKNTNGMGCSFKRSCAVLSAGRAYPCSMRSAYALTILALRSKYEVRSDSMQAIQLQCL